MKGLLLLLFLSASAFAEKLPTRVVLVVLDGVRRQEAFYPKSGQDPFPLLRSRIQSGDILSFGDPKLGEKMSVINDYALSLPGYQSILSGQDSGTKCTGNNEKECPLQPHETFLDRFEKEAARVKTDLVSLASWSGLDRAVSVNRSPAFFHNAAFTSTGSPDEVMNEKERPYFIDLDHRIQSDLPDWEHSRKDHYTREYYEKLDDALSSRLSFIQLVDSDEWAHKNDFWRYYQVIRENDEWLDGLFRKSDEREAAGLSGPTHFIITTDHGRGEGKTVFDVFREHGKWQPSSYFIWSFVRVSPSLRSKIKKATSSRYSHASIRPTIEYLMGLNPSCEANCLVR